jgi:hypothetical protein
MDVEVIWMKRTPEYFCEKGWTGNWVICPSGKIDRPQLLIFEPGSNACAVPSSTGTA